MPLYAYGDRTPRVDPAAFVHPDAVIIGDVTVGPESSIWPHAVLRADHGAIRVGARTSVQDGTVVHCTHTLPTVVGDDCTIGHLVHLEGCTIEDGALVGSGAIVLHEAVIGSGALVGAGALVTNRTRVPPGALAIGVPARIREGAADADEIRHSAAVYVDNARRYPELLRRID
jgi:carbonic anhydrase/acetyltransferase-like protein (isoleucine patch superfamily)